MVAPLMSVPAVGLLARPAVAPVGAAAGLGVPAAQDFSAVLAAERSGGESLPQPSAPLPLGTAAGNGLPEAGAAQMDAGTMPGAAADQGGRVDTLATEQRTGPAGDASLREMPKDVPEASARAQARAAAGSAVVVGLPPQALAARQMAGAGSEFEMDTAAIARSEVETMRGGAGPVSPPAGPSERAPEVRDGAGGKASNPGMAEAELDSSLLSVPGSAPDVQGGAGEAASPGMAGAELDSNLLGVTGSVPDVLGGAGEAANSGMAEAELDSSLLSVPGSVREVPAEVNIQALMAAIQRDTGRALPPAVREALEVQQRRLDAGSPAAAAAVLPGVSTSAPDAGQVPLTVAAPPSAGALSMAGPAAGLSPGMSAEMPAGMAAEQARVRLTGADALARMASGGETAVEAADDKGLQATVLRTGTDGLRAGTPLTPGLAQLPAMPPGVSQGLSAGNAAWGQAISDRVLLMTAGSLQVAEIRLDPPELGTLHVRLQLNQDQASLSFSSPHAQVRDALEQQMPRLREMLAEQGLNLEDSSVADDSQRQDRAKPESGSGGGSMAEQEEDAALAAESPVSVSRSLVDDYA